MKVHFISLGCKTNQYETNSMEQSFIKKGYEIVSKDEKADIYIVNTCSVTNIAERKSRQMLRRAKESNPDAIIVASGCYAQVAKEEIAKIKEVDLIVGVTEKNSIVEILEDYLKQMNLKKQQNDKSLNEEELATKESNKKELATLNQKTNLKIRISDIMKQTNYEENGITTYTEQSRAVIKIQDGCDRFCTYCIIPYARGRVRSRNPENIIKEIKAIAKKGIKEVVLTGIHIASYGKDFNKEKVEIYRKEYGYDNNYEEYNAKEDLSSGGFRLIELLEQINKIQEIERIRLGSIEPKLITEEFVERLSKLEKICNHFHLSLQSGSDETLKRMNRRYSTEEFEKSCKLLRQHFEDLVLTTDIIVGFPGETDEEFEETYNFLKKIEFYKMHVFKYSPKKGTVAEKMENQVDGSIKELRSQKLIELSNKSQIEFNKKFIGKYVDVLYEEQDKNGYYKGRCSNYILVKFKEEEQAKDKLSIDSVESDINKFDKKILNESNEENLEKNDEEKLDNQIVKVKITGLDGLDLVGYYRREKCQEQS